MADLVAIGAETSRIDNRDSLEKEFIDPYESLGLVINHIDSYHSCIRGHLTLDTNDIFWINDYVLIMNYEFLSMRFSKYHTFDRT